MRSFQARSVGRQKLFANLSLKSSRGEAFDCEWKKLLNFLVLSVVVVVERFVEELQAEFKNTEPLSRFDPI